MGKTALLVEHAPARADGFVNFFHEYRPAVHLETWRCYAGGGPPTTSFDGLVLSGGPMMVGDLRAGKYPFFDKERLLIDQAVREQLPVLGVCLGSQILCDHFGGTVEPGAWVTGWQQIDTAEATLDDPLFATLHRFTVFQYHRDHLVALPPGAVCLATSSTTRHEAFRLQNNVWGCLFHPEIEIRQVLQVNDDDPDIFRPRGLTRSDLAVLDDGRAGRHTLLTKFFQRVSLGGRAR